MSRAKKQFFPTRVELKPMSYHLNKLHALRTEEPSQSQSLGFTDRGLSHAAALLLSLAAMSAFAANWPQWRGPNGDGISAETNVPIKWSATENVVWKTPIPGDGHSSPVVWQDSVFLTTALPESKERLLLRLDARTGKVLWQRTVVTAAVESMHRENSPASSTPVTDGERVFTSFQNGKRVDLQGYDFAGQQIWSAQPLEFNGEHGYSYTPLLYRDLLILDCRQEGEAALLALDKRTGKVRWRVEPSRRRISHITPLLVTDDGRQQVIVCGSDEIRSVNPDNGKTWWWCRGPSDVAVAGLSYGDGLVFATAGYPDRTRMAVRVNGSGDVTATHVAWKSRKQVTYVPSPVYHAGHFYSILDQGMLCCFNAKTGDTVWEQRLEGRFRSSLVLAADNVYATNDKGVTTVFRATPRGFEPVSVNDLGEFCYTTPAIADGHIYLRTGKHLYCIGKGPT
ncbi:MAG: PQQ-binding-like beta-propeller repeat protein [Verrucomicrobia bacterium]|nr:PQQ-binding-like beta-propeller repeat protein [Verrucomicrobiota bacterium]